MSSCATPGVCRKVRLRPCWGNSAPSGAPPRPWWTYRNPIWLKWVLHNRPATSSSRLPQNSTHQHRATVYVEDLAGDESRVPGTEKQDGRGDFLRRGDAPQRDLGEDLGAVLGIVECAGGHRSVHPARRDTVHVDAVRSQLGREPLRHA